ncbi:hypothetical protein [Aureitalea marina]|uniref:Glycerophosphoryl diester phosphodiesterase membrane domain-containing protein n=1 Tax=Aureitalea marina TaxID=930804 RepID=A0A2S7KPU4_9FLAO|nr:hypothetical protein [Aureitalea marina]PQB04649.1 hypothetical protein BST85_06880 [Aureitalea marina]
MKETIQFRKQRELGDILSDTFKFIRMEWKPLGSLIIRIPGIALLAVVLSYIYYIRSTVGSFGLNDSSWPGSAITSGFEAVIAVFLLLGSALIFYSLLYGTILFYIKEYVQQDGEVDPRKVERQLRDGIWDLFGLNFLNAIIIVAGSIFCLIPGIYFAVVLASTFSIMIMEKRDITDSIGYSFKLIKGEWWITFATLLVVGILYYIIALIFQVPQYLYFFVRAFTSSAEISGDPGEMFDWIYVALSSIGMMAQYLLQTIMVVATALVYFNLHERKFHTGTLETIESIGKRER